MSAETEPARAAADLLRGRSTVTIMTAMSPQEPHSAIRKLLAEARRFDIEVTLLTACIDGSLAYLTDEDVISIRERRLHLVTLAGGVPRALGALADSIPQSLWNIDRMLQDGTIACDIYVVRATATPEGGIDVGAAVAFTPTMLAQPAVQTIVELDATGPHGLCDDNLDWSRCLVWASDELHGDEAASPEPAARAGSAADPAQVRIAEHVAQLVPEDATVQLGIGSLADAIATALRTGPSAGIHCGSVPGGVLMRIRQGEFARATDHADAGLQIATSLAETPARSGHRVPDSVRLRPIGYTHDPEVLAGIPVLWAINSALSIDVRGQVNSEWISGARVASAGGLRDFTAGAQRSSGGGSVVALPSRTRSGHSRILAMLEAPAAVSAGGHEVGYLVTEYGVATLHGRTQAQRAESIIAIAHPDDRDALSRGV
ncbi:acetyl-CoA hydrolase/transferase C-terminal domain-containing protein [Microbacterium suwonense]|uniref:Acetyl-CoA hydrolase n=1 Tax=Microbacterium suwonense TaxID=683047 RepID=A0ABN6X3N4_9MICO|nr:acetyl-CoA hydrolase/transferase C-terminal domain-containing protein [Microbacterium suwonense]BDZ39314.1 acetyl-CoA hydrolase [Microbacterium suwonense]